MALPTFLPLTEAANKLGLSEAELRLRVESGTITAGKLPDGEIIVRTDTMTTPQDDINARLKQIRREDFEHLRGQPITVSEAARKYGEKYEITLHRQTIWEWVEREYITVLEGGYRAKIDEADIAYCAAIQAVRKKYGVPTGFPLLDESGRPGLLKHPNLSRYRREKRRKK